MSLNHTHLIIAEIRCTAPLLQQGLASYRLQFPTHFDVLGHRHEMQLQNARMRVSAGYSPSSFAFLGTAAPEAPFHLRTTDHAYPTQMTFETVLSPPQLVALETLRNGGDLDFQLHLSGESFGPYGFVPAHDDVHVHVPQSQWIKQLELAGFAEILLLEVPFSTAAKSELRTALEHLKGAQDLFRLGRYDETVAKCRLALEAVAEVLREGPTQIAAATAYSEKRTQMTSSDRLLMLREAARHFTHLAHHGATQYSRADPNMILHTAAALLQHACSSVRDVA